METELRVEPRSLKKLSFKSLKRTLDLFFPWILKIIPLNILPKIWMSQHANGFHTEARHLQEHVRNNDRFALYMFLVFGIRKGFNNDILFILMCISILVRGMMYYKEALFQCVAYIYWREESLDGKFKNVNYSVFLKGGDELDEVNYFLWENIIQWRAQVSIQEYKKLLKFVMIF